MQRLRTARRCDRSAVGPGYARGELLAQSDPEQADALLSGALREARSYDERYLLDDALVSIASIRAAHGDPDEAHVMFADVVRHWRSKSDWTHQWTTLRNVVALFVRCGRPEPAAVLATALLDGSRPYAIGFGTDADRLQHTASVLTESLGQERYLERAAQAVLSQTKTPRVSSCTSWTGRQRSSR
jgi:hypothetical protein